MFILFANNLIFQSEQDDLLQDLFWENPFIRRVWSKHVSFEEKRISTLNKHMNEQGDLLSRMTWIMCQIVLKHVMLMKARRSTCENETIWKRTKKSVADHDVSHESRITTFRCEARAENQRSRIDSENWELSR